MDINDPNNPVAVYLREVANVPPLTNEEEAELFRQLEGSHDWDEAQQNVVRRLIESQLALVVTLAERYSSSGIPPMLDLIQEGNLGLMKAIKSFATRPVGDFRAHAAVYIENAIASAENELKRSKG